MYSHSISHTLQYSNVYLSTYLTLLHYRWVLLWVLGCVTLLPAVRGSQEAGFTLARAHLLADPSTSSADVVVLTLQLHLMQPTPLVLIPPSLTTAAPPPQCIFLGMPVRAHTGKGLAITYEGRNTSRHVIPVLSLIHNRNARGYQHYRGGKKNCCMILPLDMDTDASSFNIFGHLCKGNILECADCESNRVQE